MAQRRFSLINHTHTESEISDLGSYLENVVEDTSPQLGGDLDMNSFELLFGSDAYLSVERTGDVVDDDTHTFSAVQSNKNGLYFLYNAGARQNSIALVFVDSNGDLVEIFAGSTTSTGSSNPDVDGDLNVYTSGGNLELKNRHGTTEDFVCWKLIVG